MKGKFIEGSPGELGVQLEPEDDNERLLLRAFSDQAQQHGNLVRVGGWMFGGSRGYEPLPGLRGLRLYFEPAVTQKDGTP